MVQATNTQEVPINIRVKVKEVPINIRVKVVSKTAAPPSESGHTMMMMMMTVRAIPPSLTITMAEILTPAK